MIVALTGAFEYGSWPDYQDFLLQIEGNAVSG